MFKEYSDIVTIDEMCVMLGIGRNNAYILLNSKKVKAYRNGRVWRIPKLAIVEFINKEAGLK